MASTNHASLVELMETPAYQNLVNDAQRFFILKYIGGGLATGTYDAVAATRLAYPKCKTPKILSYQLMSKRCMRKVLALHWHRSAMDEVLSDLQRLIKQ